MIDKTSLYVNFSIKNTGYRGFLVKNTGAELFDVVSLVEHHTNTSSNDQRYQVGKE